jgi:hypothetical protein
MPAIGPSNSVSTIIVDSTGHAVADPQTNIVAQPQPIGRQRLVWALPLNPGPRLVSAGSAVAAPSGAVLSSPAAEVVGAGWVIISRLLIAVPTEDTRSLGGGGTP